MTVLISPEVNQYFYELALILHDEGYFCFLDSAKAYVKKLAMDIKTTLPYRQKRFAPPHFKRLGNGMYYSIFKTNKRTQWYVFFNIYEEETGELTYLVKYISNNHMIAHLL